MTVSLSGVVVVVSGGVEWMQARGASSFDPTFTRYPIEFMALSPLEVGVRAVSPSLPSAALVVLFYEGIARRQGPWVSAALLTICGQVVAGSTAVLIGASRSGLSLAAALAVVGGVVAAIGAAGACTVFWLLRPRLSG